MYIHSKKFRYILFLFLLISICFSFVAYGNLVDDALSIAKDPYHELAGKSNLNGILGDLFSGKLANISELFSDYMSSDKLENEDDELYDMKLSDFLNLFSMNGKNNTEEEMTRKAILENPSLDLFYNDTINIYNSDVFVKYLYTVFGQNTMIFFDGDVPEQLKEVEMIKSLLVRLGASYSKDNEKSNLVLLDLRNPSTKDNENMFIVRAKKQVKNIVLDAILNFQGCKETLPMIVMQGITVAHSHKDLEEGVANAKKIHLEVTKFLDEKEEGKTKYSTAQDLSTAPIIHGFQINNYYDLLQAHLIGISPSLFLSQLFEQNNRKNKLVILKESFSFPSNKITQTIETMGPPEDKFEVIDTTVDSFYDGLYTYTTNNRIKKYKFRQELLKISENSLDPLVFIGGECYGGKRELLNAIKEVEKKQKDKIKLDELRKTADMFLGVINNMEAEKNSTQALKSNEDELKGKVGDQKMDIWKKVVKPKNKFNKRKKTLENSSTPIKIGETIIKENEPFFIFQRKLIQLKEEKLKKKAESLE